MFAADLGEQTNAENGGATLAKADKTTTFQTLHDEQRNGERCARVKKGLTFRDMVLKETFAKLMLQIVGYCAYM